MRGIGQLARDSGLTVSALRFYDGAGILVPALVDPRTGYRWYTEEQIRPARLLAGLRRAGMPLADIAQALNRCADPAAVRQLLDAHLRRLEDDLTDARRAVAQVHALLDAAPPPASGTAGRVVTDAAGLRAALDAVRFAVGQDPHLPMLRGVLLEPGPEMLSVVATDRYRLAASAAPVIAASGTPGPLLVPVGFVDAARAVLDRPGPVTLDLAADAVSLAGPDQRVEGRPLRHEFPDYRRLLPTAPGRRLVTVDGQRLRRVVSTAPTIAMSRPADGAETEITVLTLDDRGRLTVGSGSAGTVRVAVTARGYRAGRPDSPRGAASGDAGGRTAGVVTRVGVNRAYLLDALDATSGGAGPLTLEVDGPVNPLGLRRPDDRRTFAILMPVQL